MSGIVRVAAVDEDVARLQQRDELVDELVDRRAGLDHHHDLARPLERGDQLLERVAADELLALAAAVDELVDLGGGAVEDGDGVAAALHVEDEVLAHHGQADQADVGGREWPLEECPWSGEEYRRGILEGVLSDPSRLSALKRLR